MRQGNLGLLLLLMAAPSFCMAFITALVLSNEIKTLFYFVILATALLLIMLIYFYVYYYLSIEMVIILTIGVPLTAGSILGSISRIGFLFVRDWFRKTRI
ncbi:hypothetical protein [Methylobacterium sp. Leaf117]|uniref:hypothetical protein n=1 Tax=Methylobacterium sp. Leaf117 TaxID=1736260 RepID=UPI00070134E2|nr:hypothetical protein [Methylobacterium sp. Leaf117]KQP96438.1 hypothetical protein ASF57_01415 [Methylobacterium sp. Leaf117]